MLPKSLICYCMALLLLSGCSPKRVTTTKEFKKVHEFADHEYHVDTIYRAEQSSQLAEELFNIPELLKNGISRHQAEALALWHNFDLQAKFKDLGIAKGDLVQAGIFSNPQLDMSIITEREEITLPAESTFTLTMSISDFWRVPMKKRLSEAKLETATRDICNTMYETVIKVRKQYHACLLMDQQYALAHYYYEKAQKILASIEARREEEQKKKHYLHNILHVYLEKELNYFKYNQKNAHLELRRLMNLPIENTILPLTDRLETLDAVVEPIETIIAKKVETFAPVKLAKIKVYQAERVIKLEQVNSLPDIQFGYYYDKVVDFKGQHGFALNSTIPIFNRNQGVIAQAYAQLEQAEQQYLAARQTLEKDILIAYNTYLRAKENREIEIKRSNVFSSVLEAVEGTRQAPLIETTWAQTYIDRYESMKDQLASLAQALDALTLFP